MSRLQTMATAPVIVIAFLTAVLLAAPGCGGVAPAADAEAAATSGGRASATPAATSLPASELTSYRRVGYDKSFKADLIDALPSPPELIVFGGSRARRFAPSDLSRATGLSAFNCAVQCFRPEDAYAFSRYLFDKAPDQRLRCVIALQTRTFNDDQMRAGLLHDERLSRAFPAGLVEEQRATLGTPPVKDLLVASRFLPRGFLEENAYDVTRAKPQYAFSRHMDLYIRRLLPNHSWNGPLDAQRSREYFEKTMRLYNDHDVIPLVVIMPYQPKALRAFRAAGFQKHLDVLTSYLRDARTRCDFRVLDLVDISSFGGSPRAFYDGAHVARENTRRIVRHAVRAAPECFR